MEKFPDLDTPDWGFSEDEPDVSVTEVRFGDGYTLRQPAGVNHIRDKWSLSWSSLDKVTAESTYQWLRVRKSLKAFLWTHPISGDVHQVVCKSVGLVYNDVNDYLLRASFEKDFNPL